MKDLSILRSCRPVDARNPKDSDLSFSPLVREAWSRELAAHSDALFRNYILDGLTYGFRIGFNYAQTSCKSSGKTCQRKPVLTWSTVILHKSVKQVVLQALCKRSLSTRRSAHLEKFQNHTNPASDVSLLTYPLHGRLASTRASTGTRVRCPILE